MAHQNVRRRGRLAPSCLLRTPLKCRMGRFRSSGLSPKATKKMTDAAWMEEALRLATQAEAAGEVPVGAIVVCDEKIVGRGFNRNRADNDPSAHAEMIALRQAG